MSQTNNQLIIYQTSDGKVKIETHFKNENVWLSTEQIAELFQRDRSVISKHIRNIFREDKLEGRLVGAIEGKTQAKDVKFYNLDVLISVGSRVKSLYHERIHQ